MDNKELDNYLTKLDKSLGPISVSEKAEIITEIKSHVMDALESNPEKTTSDILTSLGQPEIVANRYLLERGLETQKPPKHPVIKWLVIGFLGTFGIIVASIFVLIWQFTPFVSVDEKLGRVKILGGLIDVNENDGKVKIGGLNVESDKNGKIRIQGLEIDGLEHSKEIHGAVSYVPGALKVIDFKFSNVKFEISNTEGSMIEHDCKVTGNPTISKPSDSMTFDFSETLGAQCHFKVPKNVQLNIKASNGKFGFTELENSVALSGANGKASFIPNSLAKYKYDLSVVNGKIAQFESSEDDKAYKIKISIVNGKIGN